MYKKIQKRQEPARLVRSIVILLTSILAITSCTTKTADHSVSFVVPETGTKVKSGEEFKIDLSFGAKADSVVYLIDSTVAARKTDTGAIKATTSGLVLGSHLVTARVYHGAEAISVNSNIVVVPSKAPAVYTYEVVHTYPHDTSSYTEGLICQDGILYESDGEYGGSSLRTAEIKSGKVLRQTSIPSRYFGEGITVIKDKINQLTYREGMRFVYDKKTLKKLGEYPFHVGREGWGMTFDGKNVYMDDGSNTIYILDKDTFVQKGSIDVYDDQGPVEQLNEMEYIDGKIYANIYTKDTLVIINPATGIVEATIDLSSLYPNRNPEADVLNGIAWDPTGRRLFVTGKKWDKLFEIRIKK